MFITMLAANTPDGWNSLRTIGEPGQDYSPRPPENQNGSPVNYVIILTSSTPASTRLAPPASAASISMRIVWPANWLRSITPVIQTASSSVAAPSS